MGFLINTRINRLVQSISARLDAQVPVQRFRQKCLNYDSYIDCSDIKEFDDSQLVDRRESLHEHTIAAIKKAMDIATTVENRYRDLIRSCPTQPPPS